MWQLSLLWGMFIWQEECHQLPYYSIIVFISVTFCEPTKTKAFLKDISSDKADKEQGLGF